MDGGERRSARVLWPLGLLLVLAITLPVSAVPALVRTNAGTVLQGGLSGLAPTLRLVDPGPRVGPATQYDIPLSSILQIFVDFPRIVVETADRVFIAPYSAFSGIGQELRVDDHGVGTGIPTTGLAAIALNGQPFRALPREWMTTEWLNQRVRILERSRQAAEQAAELGGATVCSSCGASAPMPSAAQQEADESDLIWGELTPVETPAEQTGALPWWVGLIAVALIVGLLLLSSGSSSS